MANKVAETVQWVRKWQVTYYLDATETSASITSSGFISNASASHFAAEHAKGPNSAKGGYEISHYWDIDDENDASSLDEEEEEEEDDDE